MTNSTKLVYPELSYQILGILFNVQNRLGCELQEKLYHQAIIYELNARNIKFIHEFYLPVKASDELIGKKFIDFVIANKIALEIKAKSFIDKTDYRQLIAYLDRANLKLGIIANFHGPKVTYKRIINPNIKL